jgi:hypothetical protein
MHKNDVPAADQGSFSETEKPRSINSDSDVRNVNAHLFGKYLLTDGLNISTGSSYGLRRATQSGCCVSYLAIVGLSSVASKITGLVKTQRNTLITHGSVT